MRNSETRPCVHHKCCATSAFVDGSRFARTSHANSSESTVCGAVGGEGRRHLRREPAQHELLDLLSISRCQGCSRFCTARTLHQHLVTQPRDPFMFVSVECTCHSWGKKHEVEQHLPCKMDAGCRLQHPVAVCVPELRTSLPGKAQLMRVDCCGHRTS